MLSLEEIRDELAQLSYKDGWSWTVHEDPYEGPYIRLIGTVPDTHSNDTINLGITTWLPPMPSRHYVAHWLFWRLERIENHECREFLKRNGKIVFDPHTCD